MVASRLARSSPPGIDRTASSLQQSHQSFQPFQSFGAGHVYYDAQIGDLNDDGFPDVVSSNSVYPSSVVEGFLNDGHGAFVRLPDLISAGLSNSILMTLGDFNGDGHLDIVDRQQFQGGLEFRAGVGNGSFAPPVDTGVSLGFSYFAPYAADMDHDGKPDLVSTGYGSGVSNIVILRSIGDGHFNI